MPTFNEKVRIFGDELEESDTFIDAQVSGYSLDGDVRPVEDTDINPREWTVPETNIKDWRRKNLLITHNEMTDVNHKIWSLIENLNATVGDEELVGAEAEIEKMVRELFKDSVRAQRGN
jgi:hypothetical protein